MTWCVIGQLIKPVPKHMKVGDCSNPKHPSHCCESLISDHRAMPPVRKPLPSLKRKLVPLSRSSTPSGSAQAGSGARVGVGSKAKPQDTYLYQAGIQDVSGRVPEFFSADDKCPVCATDRYSQPKIRLLVSPCYHKMCEACIDRLFTLGPEPCPICGKILRKLQFAHQTFEDLRVEKEVAVRRRMAENFNKRREDFASDREYDDYLEEVEDLTFNLLNNIDLPETERRIAAHAQANAALISANAEKLKLEALSQRERDELERKQREERQKAIREMEEFERAEEERIRGLVIQAMAGTSAESADEILARHKAAKAARQAAFNSMQGADADAVDPALETASADPMSAHYDGPYVPIPYADPSTAPYASWFTLKAEYMDSQEGVKLQREDPDGKRKAGGYILAEYWEQEIASAVYGLGVDVLRGL